MTFTQTGTTQDKPASTYSGWLALLVALALILAGGYIAFTGVVLHPYSFEIDWLRILAGGLVAIAGIVVWSGIFILDPNESAVFQFFGSYVGTTDVTGYRFRNPFYSITKVSRRLQTIEVKPIKVNDATGNPIEIGAIVVCHVEDCARSVFDVSHVWQFVGSQADSALRRLASDHAYDAEELKDAEENAEGAIVAAGKPTLLNGGESIIESLEKELRERVSRGGVQIDEARISHLAYAPEIASAMLRRQQASAIIAARKKIVEGAVDMTHDAIEALKTKSYKMTPEQSATLVSNMLVVLVGDKDPVPVIATGK